MGGANCAQTQEGAVRTGVKMGTGSDLDAAVLAAMNIGGNGLVQRLQLSFSCEELINMDTFSKSDPFAILFLQRGSVWQKIGQTEVIHDNLNPRWVQKITVDYHFEQQEKFKVQVFDSDDDKQLQNLQSHDFIGEIEFQLHEVVTTRDQSLTKPLINAKHARPGRITVTAEELTATANTEHVMFVPEARDLKDMSGQAFFIIYKNLGPSQYTPVYKSETRSASGGIFKWNMVQIGTTDLCKDEVERQISIEFFRFNSHGKHKIIGTCNTVTLALLKSGQQDFNVTKTGNFKFSLCKVERVHSFLEYVFAGCQIDLTIAIDFTLSNGNPSTPQSLHYFDPNRNQYLQAIRNVGEILQYYNTDKQIALYGFGGAVPPYNQRASHCFALNGNIFDPRVNGLESVVSCYQNALQKCPLYGPTHFSEVLQQVVSKIESDRVDQFNQRFSILLLITDGIINDMPATIDQIVKGSQFPLGIIIVGVGEADFSNMDTLDGDEQALYSQAFRSYASADIVQFVPFNQFKSNPTMLAKETLNEIPGQLLNWYRRHNIRPYQSTEETRSMLQKQLSMKTGQQTPVPPYYIMLKQRMLDQCQQMGMDPFEVQDFIEQKGLYEYNINVVLDQMKNPAYVNPLRRQMVMYQQPQFMGSQVQRQQPIQGPAMMAPGQPVMMQGPMMGQGQQMYGQNVMLNNMAMGVQQRFQQQQVNYTYLDPTQPQDRQL